MSRRNLIWMCVILAAAGLIMYLAGLRREAVSQADPDAQDLPDVIHAYKIIRESSYRPPDPDQACRGAIEGIARQVDEHSSYVPPGKARPLARRLGGRVRETGLRVAERDGDMAVVGPLRGSPAHKAGLFAGMEIETINSVEAKYLTVEQADTILQAADAPVELTLRRESGPRIRRTLRPTEFDIETVGGLVRDARGRWRFDLDARAGFYYLRITEFVPRTPGEFHEAYRGLSDPRGLVLDLRGNPGGELQKAAEVADRFLRAGTIVRTVHRHRRPYEHHAHPLGTYPPVPLVVLIDEGTASAAEIVAAALQIRRRALLVGRCSYGKWSVQTAVDLGGGLGTLYLTTGRYFLAQPLPTTGPATQATRPDADPPGPAQRVVPDVDVRLTASAARRLARLRVRAAVMPVPRDPDRPVRAAAASVRLRREILTHDEQLTAALELLREGTADPDRLAVPATQPGDPAP